MTADLTGWSTLALALVTTLLAGAAFAQIVQSQRGEKRRFEFELFRLAQSQAPIIVGDVKYDGTVFDLRFRNVGNGAAINMRFSGLVNGQEFSAAQHGIPAIGAAAERVAMGRQSGQGLAQLLIRYEDVFGNVYATEYQRLTSDSAWYVWRRPHLGRGFFPRPSFCSEDYPEWVSKAGFTSMLARGYGSMTSLMSVFLTLEALETAALQDVAAVVLQTAQNGARQFNAGNLILIGDQYIKDESAGGEPVERRTRARLVVGEAIGYLLSQNCFAISGEIGAGSGLELQVTRLGRTIKTREDFSSYGKASLVPPELLHPKLVAVVRPLFLSGQYDAAVLTAFKQIEIAVREIGPSERRTW